MTPARISGVSMLPPCASGTSDERASRLAGRHPDRAVHRVHRQVDCVVAEPGLEAAQPVGPVELPDPHHLGQRVLQRRGGVGGGERAEQRHGRGRRPVPGRLDRRRSGPRACRRARRPPRRTGRSAGSRTGTRSPRETRSPTPRTRPAKQSSVNSSSTVPGATRATGGDAAERPGVLGRRTAGRSATGIASVSAPPSHVGVGRRGSSSRCTRATSATRGGWRRRARSGRARRAPSRRHRRARRRRSAGSAW